MTITGNNSLSTVNVGTSSTEVLAANSKRLHAVITNMSDTVIYISEGAAAEASKGIPLAPADTYTSGVGGRYATGENSVLFRGPINAIHGGSGNKAVAVKEN